MKRSAIFEIKYKDKDSNARTGILHTKKGSIETPFFMPVATKASVKHISSKDLESIGVNAIISNTFVLHAKPGEKLIRELGGIGKFMNFRGINVTDSGGFQMYSDRCYISSTEKEVIFRNPFTGEKMFISPEKDIAEAVRKTSLWAERCRTYHNKMQGRVPLGKRQLLFGIMQGGTHRDLREKSAKEIVQIGFDGYALGGLALGETKEQEYRAIKIQKKIIPENFPVYLMGAGHPAEVLEAISLGVDMFDSRFPTQNARRGTLFTSKGKLKIFNNKYERDKAPIDSECNCFVCKNYSRAYVRYQLAQEEGVGFRLASYHNIHYMSRLLEQARLAIKNKKFQSFKKKISQIYEKSNQESRRNFRKFNVPGK